MMKLEKDLLFFYEKKTAKSLQLRGTYTQMFVAFFYRRKIWLQKTDLDVKLPEATKVAPLMTGHSVLVLYLLWLFGLNGITLKRKTISVVLVFLFIVTELSYVPKV